MIAWLVLVIGLQLAQLAQGLYFLVGRERKCFNVEQPNNTPMVFAYEVLDSGHKIEFSLYYGALAAPELLISTTNFTDSVGHVDFTADNSGYYSYCLQQQAELIEHPVRVKLLINYGYDSEYYEKLMKTHNFDTVNLEIHKLNDMMNMALNEADYQKHKEVEYHEQTETMNTATLWWPMLQIGILVITGIFQVQYLKSFFKFNKLI